MQEDHDGAPAHFERRVRERLSVIYGERWIGRAGPVAWPPRSPDLTPLDFFLWGHVKNLEYRDGPVNTSDELKTRIENRFEIVKSDTNTLRRVQAHIFKHANKCVEVQGGHIQQLM